MTPCELLLSSDVYNALGVKQRFTTRETAFLSERNDVLQCLVLNKVVLLQLSWIIILDNLISNELFDLIHFINSIDSIHQMNRFI